MTPKELWGHEQLALIVSNPLWAFILGQACGLSFAHGARCPFLTIHGEEQKTTVTRWNITANFRPDGRLPEFILCGTAGDSRRHVFLMGKRSSKWKRPMYEFQPK